MSQVDCNNGKTTWIALQIASTPTLFSRFGPQWLLAVCRPQKNAPEKEIWLQWRDIGNWGVFLGQKQIILQKKLLEKHWNQCITLKGDYVDEKSQILPKSCCFISLAWDLLSDVLQLFVAIKIYEH